MNKQMGLKRRDVVGVMGLGAALVGGCATTGGAGGNMGKVIVVGGGYGGATAAKYLRMWSEGRIEVTLIEPNRSFVSCPISNLVVGGVKQNGDITVPYDNLARRHGVKVVHDTVASIDPAQENGAPGQRRHPSLRPSGAVARHRSDVGQRQGLAGREPGWPHPAGVEGRAGDGRAAPAVGSHVGRRRLCDRDSRSAVPLPAGPVRTCERGGRLLQAGPSPNRRC